MNDGESDEEDFGVVLPPGALRSVRSSLVHFTTPTSNPRESDRDRPRNETPSDLAAFAARRSQLTTGEASVLHPEAL